MRSRMQVSHKLSWRLTTRGAANITASRNKSVTLRDLLKGIKPHKIHREVDRVLHVGKEVW